MKSKRREWRYGLLAVLALIILWQVAAVALDKSYILPTPIVTFAAMVDLLGEPALYIAFGYTLLRFIMVVGISMALGILLGVLAGVFFPVEALMRPIVQVARALPTIVLIVYVGLWMAGFWAPIFVTVLITFPIVYGNILEGYRHMDQKIIEMAYLYRVPWLKQISKVFYPSIKPYLQAGLSSILGLGLKVIIASEILSQTSNSVGRLFQVARMNIETPDVLALAILTIGVAIALEYFFKKGFENT